MGSHKGSCHIFDTSGTTVLFPLSIYSVSCAFILFCMFTKYSVFVKYRYRIPVPQMMNPHIVLIIAEKKLLYKSQIDLRIRKKKSGQKKITGFQVM